ncbi:MAG TPA: asparagine synthase (glutamine-hydrolyzing), partial [Candidatus Fraserbacteria bacterium]|nr:asparagine synthase (glutamine-hydrolyzing) [Candidatus Fraserbacteria bacterium]
MCGIAGFLQQNNNTVGLEALRRMGRSLKHRGPDDEGLFIVDARRDHQGDFMQSQGTVGLAQQRLSILDLSPKGHQPMSDQARETWVNFNGEIYNFWEIRRELEDLGYCFQSRSDTEVIVYAYRQWGIACLERFNGMFALSIWDGRRKKLYLARDRLGIKPLYYYYQEGNFAFGSELKALREYPYFEAEIDLESLYDYLQFQYVPTPRAIYRNTYKLTPGHYLALDLAGGLEERCYWDPIERFRSLSGAGQQLSEAEALAQLEELLQSSVRYRMISDVPLGVLLSGGIDSSTVAALMQRLSDRPIQTFSIGFSEASYNEAHHAQAIARHLGTEHHELYVSPREAQSVIPQLPLFYDEPFADSSAIPTYLVAKLARGQVKVALSGDGGDELFCGYTRYDWMRRFAGLGRVPRPLRQGLAGALGVLPPKLVEQAYRLVRPITPEKLRVSNVAEKFAKFRGVLGSRELIELYPITVGIWNRPELEALLPGRDGPDEQLAFYRAFRAVPQAELMSKLMLVDLVTYLVDDILTKVDRASMAVSLEARVPLLD